MVAWRQGSIHVGSTTGHLIYQRVERRTTKTQRTSAVKTQMNLSMSDSYIDASWSNPSLEYEAYLYNDYPTTIQSFCGHFRQASLPLHSFNFWTWPRFEVPVTSSRPEVLPSSECMANHYSWLHYDPRLHELSKRARVINLSRILYSFLVIQ